MILFFVVATMTNVSIVSLSSEGCGDSFVAVVRAELVDAGFDVRDDASAEDVARLSIRCEQDVLVSEVDDRIHRVRSGRRTPLGPGLLRSRAAVGAVELVHASLVSPRLEPMVENPLPEQPTKPSANASARSAWRVSAFGGLGLTSGLGSAFTLGATVSRLVGSFDIGLLGAGRVNPAVYKRNAGTVEIGFFDLKLTAARMFAPSPRVLIGPRLEAGAALVPFNPLPVGDVVANPTTSVVASFSAAAVLDLTILSWLAFTASVSAGVVLPPITVRFIEGNAPIGPFAMMISAGLVVR